MFIKLDSLRFKINLSNSFGTLEGALIPQDNVTTVSEQVSENLKNIYVTTIAYVQHKNFSSFLKSC